MTLRGGFPPFSPCAILRRNAPSCYTLAQVTPKHRLWESNSASRNEETVLRVFRRALSHGAKVVGVRSLLWDLSRGCENPVGRTYETSVDRWFYVDRHVPDVRHQWVDGLRGGMPSGSGYYKTEILMKCRKCQRCIKARARMWSMRAVQEVKAAPRTWLLTLTLAGEARTRFLYQERLRMQRRGWLHQDFDDARDYRLVAGKMLKELTLMWKRLRKAGHRFRYLAVVEYHKDGFPHIHALVHCADTMTYRAVAGDWPHGFAHAKLANDSAAAYVTKYVTKDLTRLRASLGYGRRS